MPDTSYYERYTRIGDDAHLIRRHDTQSVCGVSFDELKYDAIAGSKNGTVGQACKECRAGLETPTTIEKKWVHITNNDKERLGFHKRIRKIATQSVEHARFGALNNPMREDSYAIADKVIAVLLPSFDDLKALEHWMEFSTSDDDDNKTRMQDIISRILYGTNENNS